MKVLVFSPYANLCPSFEHELEFMQMHLDAGDEVAIAVCNATLPSCDSNPQHDPSGCSGCVGRRLFGLVQLSKPVCQIPILGGLGPDLERGWKLPYRVDNLEKLLEIHIDNLDLGLAVYASLVHVLRETRPDLTEPSTQRLTYRLLLSTFQVYRWMIRLLNRQEIDRVYLFNGQWSVLRAAWRACQFEGVECYIHEKEQASRYFEVSGQGRGLYRSIELRETGFFASLGDSLRRHPWLDKTMGTVSAAFNSARLGGNPF